DVNSLPSSFRPKKEKGKRTLADYGLRPQVIGANVVTFGARNGGKQLVLKVLDYSSTGIFVCITEPGQNAAEAKAQSVVLLKRKDTYALLKTHATFREFASCPAIGTGDTPSAY